MSFGLLRGTGVVAGVGWQGCGLNAGRRVDGTTRRVMGCDWGGEDGIGRLRRCVRRRGSDGGASGCGGLKVRGCGGGGGDQCLGAEGERRRQERIGVRNVIFRIARTEDGS